MQKALRLSLHQKPAGPSKVKAICVSDFHFDGKNGFHSPDRTEFARELAEEIIRTGGDLLVVNGDVAGSKEAFLAALDLLSRFNGRKLLVAGNYELGLLERATLANYWVELGEICAQFGFHLLDREPFFIGGFAFVGNVGWHDLSFAELVPDKAFVKAEMTRQTISERVNSFHRNKYRTGGLGFDEFLSACLDRIRQQLDLVAERGHRACLCIHHVGFRRVLDFHNVHSVYMGSDRLVEPYTRPEVDVGFFGHIHRYDSVALPGKHVYGTGINPNNPHPYFELVI